MTGRIILPKTYINPIDQPLIFLAGPIRDAPDWQELTIKYIISNSKNVLIANPRWNASRYIQDLAISGKTNHFDRQRAWEKHYLDIASKKGCVLFWLENAPGMMTRFELGQLSRQYKFDKSTRFCVGGDERFSDIQTIEYDLFIDTGKEIYSTLEQTCDEALKLANITR